MNRDEAWTFSVQEGCRTRVKHIYLLRHQTLCKCEGVILGFNLVDYQIIIAVMLLTMMLLLLCQYVLCRE